MRNTHLELAGVNKHQEIAGGGTKQWDIEPNFLKLLRQGSPDEFAKFIESRRLAKTVLGNV